MRKKNTNPFMKARCEVWGHLEVAFADKVFDIDKVQASGVTDKLSWKWKKSEPYKNQMTKYIRTKLVAHTL